MKKNELPLKNTIFLSITTELNQNLNNVKSISIIDYQENILLHEVMQPLKDKDDKSYDLIKKQARGILKDYDTIVTNSINNYLTFLKPFFAIGRKNLVDISNELETIEKAKKKDFNNYTWQNLKSTTDYINLIWDDDKQYESLNSAIKNKRIYERLELENTNENDNSILKTPLSQKLIDIRKDIDVLMQIRTFDEYTYFNLVSEFDCYLDIVDNLNSLSVEEQQLFRQINKSYLEKLSNLEVDQLKDSDHKELETLKRMFQQESINKVYNIYEDKIAVSSFNNLPKINIYQLEKLFDFIDSESLSTNHFKKEYEEQLDEFEME